MKTIKLLFIHYNFFQTTIPNAKTFVGKFGKLNYSNGNFERIQRTQVIATLLIRTCNNKKRTHNKSSAAMKYLMVFILMISFVAKQVTAQTEWKSFTNKRIVTCITFDGNTIWAGTTGGLVKLNSNGDIVAEYERDEGLAGINVTCSAVDIDDRLWIGTYGGGISVFDGSKWKTYNLQNSGLGSNNITSIKIDTNGNKWITTYSGAYMFNNTSWTHIAGLPSGTVYSVIVDKDNNKWFTTYNGVAKYNNGILKIFNTKNSGLLSDIVRDVAIDSKGRKWFVGPREIAMYDDNEWFSRQLFEEGDFGENTNDISCLAIDKNDNCYIGTAKGVYTFDRDSLTANYKTSNSNIISNTITSIEIDTSGNIWCGVYGGISVFNGKDWNNIYISTPTVNSNNVFSIAIDKQGRRWFGCENGVSVFDDNGWTTYSSANSGLKCWLVSAIACDRKGNMWFGGDEGIFVFDGSSWTKHNIGNVKSIVMGQSDSIWIANWEGLHLFDGIQWTTFDTSNSNLPSNEVQALAIDSKGNKWVATNGGGAAKLSGSTWTIYNHSNSGLMSDRVRCVAVDLNDRVWFSTDLGTNSVAVFDGIIWQNYYKTYYVSAIAVDKFNNKWFGTALNGVMFFNNKSWKEFNLLNSGINSDYVRTIAVDDDENVWIGTAQGGISKFYYSLINSIVRLRSVPNQIDLSQNYPNPFNPTTTISFQLSAFSKVRLCVYDLLGREVAVLVNEEKLPGNYEVTFDGTNLPSGVYFYSFSTERSFNVKKMLLLK